MAPQTTNQLRGRGTLSLNGDMNMDKKKEEISDRLNDCLNGLLFDSIIDADEKVELSRKLGVLFKLPDMLPYYDLREIAFRALEEEENRTPEPKKKTFSLNLLRNLAPKGD